MMVPYKILRLIVMVAIATALAGPNAMAQATAPAEATKAGTSSSTPAGQEDLGAIAKKLNNPLGNVWALQFEFDWTMVDGDLVDGHEDNYAILFQPILPIPLTREWNILSRPVVPLLSAKAPDFDQVQRDIDFDDRETGLGDIVLPLLLTPAKPEGHWQFGAGPSFIFPTATEDLFESGKWSAGPAGVAVYKSERITTGGLAQYWWDYAGWGDSSVSKGSLLYFFWYMLPSEEHWQIGMNPTITYNHMADSDNQWNVPVGLTVGRMFKFGKLPVKIQAGVDYSVINQDDYGNEWKFKLLFTPVIPGLIDKPLFEW